MGRIMPTLLVWNQLLGFDDVILMIFGIQLYTYTKQAYSYN
jgi:hypothetical protein